MYRWVIPSMPSEVAYISENQAGEEFNFLIVSKNSLQVHISVLYHYIHTLQ